MVFFAGFLQLSAFLALLFFCLLSVFCSMGRIKDRKRYGRGFRRGMEPERTIMTCTCRDPKPYQLLNDFGYPSVVQCQRCFRELGRETLRRPACPVCRKWPLDVQLYEYVLNGHDTSRRIITTVTRCCGRNVDLSAMDLISLLPETPI